MKKSPWKEKKFHHGRKILFHGKKNLPWKDKIFHGKKKVYHGEKSYHGVVKYQKLTLKPLQH